MLTVDVSHPRLGGRMRCEVASGTLMGLYGPSGAGKTTWIRVLAGFLPGSGSVDLDGVNLIGLTPERRPLAYVPQAPSVFPHLSVAGQVAAARPEAGAAEPLGDVLEALGLAEVQHRLGRMLSGGQGQRVALARAIHRAPAVLLLDEPLSAVDRATRSGIMEYLWGWARRHSAHVVWASHDWADMERWADRVLLLDGGRAVGFGAPGALADNPPTAAAALLMGYRWVRGFWLHPARTRAEPCGGPVLEGVVEAVRRDGFRWIATLAPAWDGAAASDGGKGDEVFHALFDRAPNPGDRLAVAYDTPADTPPPDGRDPDGP